MFRGFFTDSKKKEPISMAAASKVLPPSLSLSLSLSLLFS